jgi:ADP-heptose:LPS heptosyltransferase
MTSPANRDIMLHNRYLNQILVFDKQAHLRRWGLKIGNSLKYLRQLRAENFDLVIVPSTVSTSLTSDFLAYFSGARVRIGARSIDSTPNPSGFLFTHAADLNWLDTPDRHQTLRNADIMGSYAEHPEDLSHEVTLLEEEEKRAIEILARWKGGRRLAIALHPGAGKRPNRWPAERFAEVAGTLADEFNAHILITAGPMDGEEVEMVEGSLHVPYNTLLNKPIRVVASILRYVDLVVSNDTGIMHVAAGVETPVLSIFGPTDPRQWAPLGGIHRYIKSETPDISEIPAQDVIRVARQMLLASAEGR